MRSLIVTLLVFGLLGVAQVEAQVSRASAGSDQGFRVMLAPDQVETLNQVARGHYEEALRMADHVQYEAAVDEVAQAAAAAPDHVELQFLLAKMARGHAEITYGEESLRYYDLAATALRRLLSNPALGPEERIRVSRESDRVTEGRETLRVRDDARMKSGFDLVMQIHRQRRLRSGLEVAQSERGTIDSYLAPQEETEESEALTKEDVWPVLGAPGLALDVLRPVQYIQPGYGAFPGAYGAEYGAYPGAYPQPYGATPYGAAPYGADPGAFDTPGADPFSGGGAAGPPGYQPSAYFGPQGGK